MNVSTTPLPGVLVVEPRVFGDARGFLFESWSRRRFEDAGLPAAFVQDNVSCSQGGVLRGLHYQHPNGQGKLVQVLEGVVYDVAVDVRRGSPTFGRWYGCTLSDTNRWQMYIPRGFAHGFLVLSDRALFTYKCTDYYRPECERTVRWDDPDIGIEWPARPGIISDKDRSGRGLGEMTAEELPEYDDRAGGM